MFAKVQKEAAANHHFLEADFGADLFVDGYEWGVFRPPNSLLHHR